MSASQGSLSASVSGVPLDIFSTLDFGWSESPSMKGIERAFDRERAMVDLPLRTEEGISSGFGGA